MAELSQIYHLDTVDSTNNYAKQQIASLQDGDVIWADLQTQGKGRLGRQWKAPRGNLFASFVYKNQTGNVSFYPLLCAVGVSRAVLACTGMQAQIKWPNDILLQEKKLCGILCESIVASSQIHIICGIGINVNTPPSAFAEEELPYATSLLAETGKSFEIDKLLAALRQELASIRLQFQTEGFAALKKEYEAGLINLGRRIQVVYQNQTLTGNCEGIGENGNLICRLDDGSLILVNSGEASVRGIYGYAL